MNKYQPDTRVGEYILEECVGAGTFGEVWRARHHVWKNDQVAVKLPTEPEYVRYLQREGVVVHGIRHPNIIRVINFDPYAENPYLVMELVDGPALRQIIDEHEKGLPLETVLIVLRGILGALSAAHEANVLHRDLKPGNIMLNLAERPLAELTSADIKIGDFGLGVSDADTLRSIAQSASLTHEDALVGTLAYMAPEFRDGLRQPDARSDLFAVGVMLFEMLTGERPAGAELPSALRKDSPTSLDEVFRRLYSRHSGRYETAQAVLDDLEQRLSPPPPPPVAGVSAPQGALTTCPACRHVIAADDQFCTQCGHQLVTRLRRCPSCHGYPGRQDQYCIFCGTVLPSEE
ncbi:MAG: serine/threonine-protein kinase [Planctomycetota bacterium]